MPIKLICRTKPSTKFRVIEYTGKKEDEAKQIDTMGDKYGVDYHYVAELRYEENQTITISMKAHACIPRVSLKT